ncbi:MAG: Oxygen-sensitive ribonucleoside-triphosphate reductase [Parcubacteria group bacterium GW2011_GWC1_45_9]|nr:MAG: Oxygen-sensitive ribonucleoside-triphosphate reductase [Parcubacteria group bacterium GW2011_GWB1_45_10]KKU16916.1 MAG: Oxygen-sensitive ribonucleoside-triphosphate reductase [Parcubacteria group bacterium GW2011_GWC1_45_9]HCI05190.1 recombinase [Patescibacteria group bacterium]
MTKVAGMTIKIPETVTKRDGRVVELDPKKIESAISRCFAGLDKEPSISIKELVNQVVNIVAVKYLKPHVEEIQDVVETVLQAAGEYEAAKHYILYRAEHAKLRAERPIPEEIRQAFAESDEFFPTPLQKFQFYDKYSRFNYELGRRETWIETVDRSVDYLKELSESKLPAAVYKKISEFILEMKAMPSMRLLAMAGPAARRNNMSIYNCSYMTVDSLDVFVEALLISMAGCGVGFSVEKQYVENLPRIRRQKIDAKPENFVIEDSAEGWGEALRKGLESWFNGQDIIFDYSSIRPAGAPLKVKGGRASGPGPLRRMLDFVRTKILSKQGNFLRPIDAHDLMCSIGDAVVSGGVRRTAMISLFDFDDMEMRYCKSGDNIKSNEQRWNANNSAVWPNRELTQTEIAKFVIDTDESGRGEPGIFSRRAALKTIPERRLQSEFGTNPCGEIILRPNEFCNLSIAVARKEDSLEGLKEKVEVAAIIGTIQSLATDFPGLRPQWKKNCEEERLLGVDINGQMDCPAVREESAMQVLKEIAVETNKKYSQILGINQSAAVTCVKPSGNSSQLLNCSSGVHARWSEFYVRNVRVGAHTPVFKVLKDAGVPMDPENGQTPEQATTWVAHFPVSSPEGAITRKHITALEQLEYWLRSKKNWTEHNPSVTVTYSPNEILDIAKWLWRHQELIGGLTFLPAFDAQYDQMPYIEINKEQYEKLLQEFPEVDFSKIYRYEEEDLTTAAQEVACLAGVCDVIL